MSRTPDTAHTQFPGRIGRTLAEQQSLDCAQIALVEMARQ